MSNLMTRVLYLMFMVSLFSPDCESLKTDLSLGYIKINKKQITKKYLSSSIFGSFYRFSSSIKLVEMADIDAVGFFYLLENLPKKPERSGTTTFNLRLDILYHFKLISGTGLRIIEISFVHEIKHK